MAGKESKKERGGKKERGRERRHIQACLSKSARRERLGIDRVFLLKTKLLYRFILTGGREGQHNPNKLCGGDQTFF